ncbi:MAG: HlyD family secretion protein [Pseudomonadota bacterium]
MKVSVKHAMQLFALVGGALVIAFFLVATKPAVQHQASALPMRAVEVITVEEIPFSNQVTAYGIVEPAVTLNSTAEVSGKVSFLHPSLKSGSTVPADTVVLRIEAEDYDVALKQAQADLAANEASLRELEAEEASAERALDLALQNLRFGEAEYDRIAKVYEQQVVTKSTLDAEEQKVISLRQAVEDVQGRINSFDSRRQSINSQIARADQAVKNATTILARTEISLPFNARVGTVSVDVGEFVAAGAPLFEAVDLNGVEISAQLSLEAMRGLMSHVQPGQGPGSPKEQFLQSTSRLDEMLQLQTRVRLVTGVPSASWNARVMRISDAIDATRQTVGIVVGVDDPYNRATPGARPPLVKGLYTAVDVIAPAQPALVVPRKAVHQGRVYTVSSERRLEIRSVEVKHVQNDLVVLEAGVAPGEQVVITDLVPVIEGMPLQVTEAQDFQAAMRRQASGASAAAGS